MAGDGSGGPSGREVGREGRAMGPFSPPAYTLTPDELFDVLLPELELAPLKILLYIVRRTLGFRQEAATISSRELQHGRRRSDGSILDRGTGLSRSSIFQGLAVLTNEGFLDVRRQMDPILGQQANAYALAWRREALEGDDASFRGFSRPTFSQTPDALFDELLPDLELGPLRVLLYLVRRTLGFRKSADTISLSQLCHGIQRHDGSRQDRGTGLSERHVQRSLRWLEEHNIVRTVSQFNRGGGQIPSTYTLCWLDDGAAASPVASGARPEQPTPVLLPSPPLSNGRHPPIQPWSSSPSSSHHPRGAAGGAPPIQPEPFPPSSGQHPQVTGIQQTEIQQAGSDRCDRRDTVKEIPDTAPASVTRSEAPGRNEKLVSLPEAVSAALSACATELGDIRPSPAIRRRLRTLLTTSEADVPTFVARLLWSCKQTKDRSELDHPLSYCLAVLENELRGSGLPPVAAAPALAVQDAAFLARVGRLVEPLPDQAPWRRVLASLAASMVPSVYSTWCAASVLISATDALVIAVADERQVGWLEQRCGRLLTVALRDAEERRSRPRRPQRARAPDEEGTRDEWASDAGSPFCGTSNQLAIAV